MAPTTPGGPIRFRVGLDSQPPGAAHGTDIDDQGDGTLTDPRLYQLIRQPGPIGERSFEITFLDPGVQAYAFTFG
jgi:Thioredoxin like C-terminal domain